MATYFVTRHAGARVWAARLGLDAQTVCHLDPGKVVNGDTVLGTLPISLVAAVNARGARYLHLEMELPAEARGRDLTADDMDRYGARLQEYRAEKVPNSIEGVVA